MVGWKLIALQQLVIRGRLYKKALLPLLPHLLSQCSGKKSMLFRTLLYETIEATGAADKAMSSMRIRIMTKCSDRTDRIKLEQMGYIV